MTKPAASTPISGWTIAIGIATAICIYWILDVRTSPAIKEALAANPEYACIRASDPGLPYEYRLGRLSEETYYSMGGENYIQGLWWYPLTKLAIRVQFSRDRISQMHAVKARPWSPYTGYDQFSGFDPLSMFVYGKKFCSLDAVRKGAIYAFYSPEYPPTDGKAKAAFDCAKDMFWERKERRRVLLGRPATKRLGPAPPRPVCGPLTEGEP